MYPLTSLHFEVQWQDSENTTSFSEVSGLTSETDPIEYRGGTDPSLTVRKIPGLKKYGNVTLKRGIATEEGANGMFDWFNTISAGSVERRNVTIILLDEERMPVMTWQLQNAWPVKVEGPGLNASANEVAYEMVEIAHEGLTVATNG